MAKWPHTCRRFVSLFDVMGFKDLSYRSTHKRVLNTMRRLADGVRQIDGLWENDSAVVKTLIFSDTILLVSRDDSKKSTHDVLLAATWLAYYCLDSAIPVKGAIALGTMTFDADRSIFCGRPLIDAYTLQDELQAYAVAVHHSAERPLSNDSSSKLLVRLKLPMRLGTVQHDVLDWTDVASGERHTIRILERLYQSVSGSTRRYVDNTVNYTKELLARRPSVTSNGTDRKAHT